MASYSPDVLQSVFVTGLKNVHGVEHQALSLIDRQLDHLENYPEVADMLRRHRVETEQQIERVDTILQGFGETPSSLKDAVLSFTGNMAALAHLPAPDEILKNSFANQAFENFEMAAYTSLIAMAEAGFANTVSALRQSLTEEQRTAQWFADNIPSITMKYVSLRAEGETASH
jgi:ferritin-like metal-binding protein YciE